MSARRAEAPEPRVYVARVPPGVWLVYRAVGGRPDVEKDRLVAGCRDKTEADELADHLNRRAAKEAQ